jgi:hypothetical protein
MIFFPNKTSCVEVFIAQSTTTQGYVLQKHCFEYFKDSTDVTDSKKPTWIPRRRPATEIRSSEKTTRMLPNQAFR